MKKISILLIIMFAMVSCAKKTENSNDSTIATDNDGGDSKYYTEKYRPQFHFTPESKWMNDPNGMVYYEGEYHLFYQFYPDSTVWGPMHWGHAISKDLISWKHLPIALEPDKLGYIFSGSAVIDKDNTSGLGSLDNPAMVAIFTYHDPEGEKKGRNDYQTQGIAYSVDKGRTWKKYDQNPVIKNPGFKDFRDPKVFWNDETSSWTLTLVAGDHAEFYSSKNLKSWTKTGEFGKGIGAHGGVWECPDLFKLKTAGSSESKWVLFISINPGAPNGGSGTQYFVGDFDGQTFTTSQKNEKWVDLGADNYAGVTFNNAPNNQRIFIGWMNNWLYATKVPTEKWRSAMTLPRTLALQKANDQYYLTNYPVAAFESILTNPVKSDKAKAQYKGNFNQSQVLFKIKNLYKGAKISFTNDKNEQLVIGVDQNKKALYIDRRKSGKVDFESKFATAIHYYPIAGDITDAEVRIILDKSSVEIFVAEGRYVMTEQVFPTEDYNTLKITEGIDNIFDVQINNVSSTWKK